MDEKLTDVQKIRCIPWLIAGGVFNSAFCRLTVFGSVFILFLSEIGLNKTRIGLLLSFLPFCGVLALVVAPAALRFGLKRTVVTFLGTRTVTVACLLATPWIRESYGTNKAFLWVAVIILMFAVFRAIAETASYPWTYEIIPNSMRGKFGALSNIMGVAAGILAIVVASYVVGSVSGLGRFMGLIAAGVFFGLASVACLTMPPGGAPVPDKGSRPSHLKGVFQALNDRNYLIFLAVLGLVTFAIAPVLAFIPLFMKEYVGIGEGFVVLLDAGILVGMLLSSYLWGWASDRYGSKPVMQTGLALLTLLPIGWFLLPQHSWASALAAMVISLLAGVACIAWTIGWERYFYVNAVPEENKTAYMAVFYAWLGLVGGFGPLLAGQLLERCRGISMDMSFLHINPYTPLFAISFVLLVASLILLHHVRAEGAMPVGQFVNMFFQGNPFGAIGSLVRYRFAGDEPSRISITERMGQAKNPLSINELLEALKDPSFNVRYEAIISIARTRPDPQLVDELLAILTGGEPDLSVAAAWALGRLGDNGAIPALRETLESDYPVLRARSARALATLGDHDSIVIMHHALQSEIDEGVRLAYASALGVLRFADSTGDLLDLLKNTSDQVARDELALALARIIGDERDYIRLWRRLREQKGTAAAQAILALKKELARTAYDDELNQLIETLTEAFARQNSARGAETLANMIRQLSLETVDETAATILRDCAAHLDEWRDERPEYILLALHVLSVTFHK